MILTIWAIFFVISLLFIIIGSIFNTTVSDVLVIVGWAFIFLLGAVLVFGSLTYKTGETETINYTYGQYNYTQSGENITNIIISSQSINKTDSYTAITSEAGFLNSVVNLHTIGFFIMIIGLFGFTLFWFDNKGSKGVNDEEA
jgi:hypothetical protein